MKCVILQPSYVPWRGYFHQIQKADIFVFYDDVQYDVDGWRNRNKIKTPQGTEWLTLPVVTKGVHTQHRTIREVEFVPGNRWVTKHLRTLRQNYQRAPHFDRYFSTIEEYYLRPVCNFSDFVIGLTVLLARELGITHTRFIRSSSLTSQGAKTDRLLSLLTQIGCTHYISGPAAQAYLEPEKFSAVGMGLEFMRYNYPPYPQLHGVFEPQVSILDLLFNTGPESANYIWLKA